MKLIRYFIILAIAFFGVSLADVNAQGDNGTKTSARTLEQKVFKEILKLPYYGVFDSIKFELDGNTVILSGKVANARNRKDAEYAVKRITGVQGVVNNIEILPLSSHDDAIRRSTLRALADKGLYRYLWEPNPSVRIIVERGHVTLEGYVAHRGDYNLMNIVAHGVTGSFSVNNNLVIGREELR